MQIPIGHSENFWRGGPFMMDGDKHASLIAESGTGKSVVMGDLAIRDIRTGRAVFVLDPHDELVHRIAGFIPKEMIDRVKWLDPACAKPIGISVLGGATLEERNKRADQFIDTASKIYGEHSWGGQSAYIARNLLYAINEVEANPNPSHLFKALVSEEYRKGIFERVRSENLKWFARKFDSDWRDQQREQAAAPSTNKADTFISNPIIRGVLCQAGGFDFFRAMQEGWIVLCPLGKGRLGPEASAFLGSLIIQECFFAGLSREKVRPADRKHVKIYVDEFHNFIKNDAADLILSELRKYAVGFVAADQNTQRMPRENFATRIAGRVDAESAKVLADEFGLPSWEHLTQIPNRHWIAQTIRPDGHKSDAVFIKGLPMLTRLGTEYPAWRVIRHSEENNGVRRELVEAKVNAFLKEGTDAVVRKRSKAPRGIRGGKKRSPRRSLQGAGHPERKDQAA